MASSPSTSYDEIPYESSAFAQPPPDRLATIGRLCGLPSPAVESCHVLELGCAAGANPRAGFALPAGAAASDLMPARPPL